MPASTTSPIVLLSLTLGEDYSLSITVNPWLVGSIIFLVFIVVIIRRSMGVWRGPNFEIDAAEIGIGSAKITFKPNLKDQEIAYKIWVELSTRKIGLPIDLNNDVISEIYDSWYNFFSITRELVKDVPVSQVKNASTRKIITLSIRVLNDGLRPHLTSWQARFRHWYEKQLISAGDDIDPQSIQVKYPKFKELEADLLAVNGRLIKYREKMRELVLGLPDDSGTEEVTSTSEPTPSL